MAGASPGGQGRRFTAALALRGSPNNLPTGDEPLFCTGGGIGCDSIAREDVSGVARLEDSWGGVDHAKIWANPSAAHG